MASTAREAKKAIKKDDLQRKRPAGASAMPGGPPPAIGRKSQAEEALKQSSTGKLYYHLHWHKDCVFDLDEDAHGIMLYVFADGSAIHMIEDSERVVPRAELLQCLSLALLEAYDHCVEREEDFVLWIAGEKFTGTPKEAFESVLRLLDAPVEPPKRMLGLIEESTVRFQLHHEYAQAALSDARRLAEAASRLRSSGALDDPCLEHLMTLVRTAEQQLQGRQ